MVAQLSEQDRKEQSTWRKMSKAAQREIADFETLHTADGLKRLRAIPDEEWQRAVDQDGEAGGSGGA